MMVLPPAPFVETYLHFGKGRKPHFRRIKKDAMQKKLTLEATGFLTPHPYKGPLAEHEHKGLERSSFVIFGYGSRV